MEDLTISGTSVRDPTDGDGLVEDPDSLTGNPMGMENLLRGQKRGHRLWL